MPNEDSAPGPQGLVIRGLVGDGAVRVVVVDLGTLANRLRQIHELGPVATQTAADALVAAVFLSAWVEDEERLTLQLQASRPRFAFVGDVDGQGGLRARLTPSHLSTRRGRDDPGKGIDGLMLTIKSNPRAEIYRGITDLSGRTIEGALSAHLEQSSQVDTIFRLGSTMVDGHCTFAGGILLERLPWSEGQASLQPEEFQERYGALRSLGLPAIGEAIADGGVLGEPIRSSESRTLHWRCSCGQARVEHVLAQLPVAELELMLEEDGGAELSCHFCNVAYTVGAQRLTEIITAGQPAEPIC